MQAAPRAIKRAQLRPLPEMLALSSFYGENQGQELKK